MATLTRTRTGQQLGNWRLLQQLGGGTYGDVYQAEHILLKRHDAIKILKPSFVSDAEVRARFLREAQITGGLDHPNIVKVYDASDVSPSPYLVMALLVGETLRQRLARGPLATVVALQIAEEIACGLAAAHKHHVVHRDLKPENIFLARKQDGSEVVKVLDFGVAKLRESAVGRMQTEQRMGTHEYMAPEQWRQQPEIDGRVDIYALGVILFECISGRLPFQATTEYELMTAHLSVSPPPLSPGSASPAVETFTHSLLAKTPTERPPDMATVAAKLAALRATHVDVLAPEAMPRAPVQSAKPRDDVRVSSVARGEARPHRPSWFRPTFGWRGLSMLLTLLTCGVAAWLWRRPLTVPALPPSGIWVVGDLSELAATPNNQQNLCAALKKIEPEHVVCSWLPSGMERIKQALYSEPSKSPTLTVIVKRDGFDFVTLHDPVFRIGYTPLPSHSIDHAAKLPWDAIGALFYELGGIAAERDDEDFKPHTLQELDPNEVGDQLVLLNEFVRYRHARSATPDGPSTSSISLPVIARIKQTCQAASARTAWPCHMAAYMDLANCRGCEDIEERLKVVEQLELPAQRLWLFWAATAQTLCENQPERAIPLLAKALGNLSGSPSCRQLTLLGTAACIERTLGDKSGAIPDWVQRFVATPAGEFPECTRGVDTTALYSRAAERMAVEHWAAAMTDIEEAYRRDKSSSLILLIKAECLLQMTGHDKEVLQLLHEDALRRVENSRLKIRFLFFRILAADSLDYNDLGRLKEVYRKLPEDTQPLDSEPPIEKLSQSKPFKRELYKLLVQPKSVGYLSKFEL